MSRSEKLKRFAVGFLCFGILALTLSACPKKQTVKTDDKLDQDDVESEELDVHGKDFVSTKNLETVRFEYDSSELQESARDILAKNAAYLKKNSDLEVLSEGHTDERGTVEYNIALGQNRAQSVRRYYISLGLNPKRLGSLSYGKEKAVCTDGTEDCRSQNRRVETKVRSMNVANGQKKEKDKSAEDKTR